MRALEAFTRTGQRPTEAGEVFEAWPVEAAAYRYQHKAEFVTDAAEPVRTKRRYRRRDMQAEDSA